MDKTVRSLLVLTAIAAAVFFIWRYSAEESEDEQEHEEKVFSSFVAIDGSRAEAHGIAVKKAMPGTLAMQLHARGKVVFQPNLVAHILPSITGIAKQVEKTIGDHVEAGEVLAILESREMAEIKAEYLAALAKEKLASSIGQREERLYQKGVSSEQEYLNAQIALEEAKIQSELAHQRLLAFGLDDLSNSNLRYYEIRSPIKGTIVSRDITFGEYVENTAPIFVVADLEKVWIELGIYPKDIAKVKAGQEVEVEGIKSKILFVSPVIDDETITVNAVVEVDNKEGILKPGLFVSAQIQVEEEKVPLIVKKTAIQMLDGEPVVFLQKGEGFEKTGVRLGRSDDENIEVVAGIEIGSKYAATNAFLLKADLGKDSVEHED